jgi:hypothetical protein
MNVCERTGKEMDKLRGQRKTKPLPTSTWDRVTCSYSLCSSNVFLCRMLSWCTMASNTKTCGHGTITMSQFCVACRMLSCSSFLAWSTRSWRMTGVCMIVKCFDCQAQEQLPSLLVYFPSSYGYVAFFQVRCVHDCELLWQLSTGVVAQPACLFSFYLRMCCFRFRSGVCIVAHTWLKGNTVCPTQGVTQ